MGFKGKFVKFIHKSGANKPGGFVHDYATWSFMLTNTSWFGSTPVRAYITDYYGRNSREYPFVSKGGETLNFNIGTIDWDWCQGDVFILYDQHGREINQWSFFLKEYGPGECPECHGTKKCGSCHGDPMKINPDIYADNYFIKCNHCHGTGKCPTCDIPYHFDALGEPIYVPPQAPKTFKSVITLQHEIEKKTQQINQLKGDLWKQKMQGRNTATMEARIAQFEKELEVLNRQLSDKMRR